MDLRALILIVGGTDEVNDVRSKNDTAVSAELNTFWQNCKIAAFCEAVLIEEHNFNNDFKTELNSESLSDTM